jgi:hypothetical protein
MSKNYVCDNSAEYEQADRIASITKGALFGVGQV